MRLFTLFQLALIILLVPMAFAQDQGIIAEWRFDEDGDAVTDTVGKLSGKIVNGQNVQRIEGKSGKGMQFAAAERGQHGCITVEGIGKLDLSKGFTIQAWIKFNDTHIRQDTCYIASDGAWKGPGWRFLISYNNLFIQSGDGKDMWGASTSHATHTGFENNRWYHVAATYDGSIYQIYIDGVEVGVSGPKLKLTKGTNTLSIGAYSGGTDSAFKGVIDDFRIYNRARTGLELMREARLD